jgi:hypothetical protein
VRVVGWVGGRNEFRESTCEVGNCRIIRGRSSQFLGKYIPGILFYRIFRKKKLKNKYKKNRKRIIKIKQKR